MPGSIGRLRRKPGRYSRPAIGLAASTKFPGENADSREPSSPYLLMGAGLFADAHRAIGDCQTLLHLLSSPFGAEGKPALTTLLANARETTMRVFAVDSPFDRKDLLKGRGYRWSNGHERLPSLLVARHCRARPRGRTCVPARQRLPAPGRPADAAHHRTRALLDEHALLTGSRPHRPTHLAEVARRRVPALASTPCTLRLEPGNVRR